MTQPDAKTYCRQKYTDLATFHNVQETQEAMAAAHASDSDYIWIGLERQTSEKFIWSYDNPNFYQPGESEYRNWDVNEPNAQNSDEKCVEMRSNARFNDYLCSEGLPFICYSGKPTCSSHLLQVYTHLTALTLSHSLIQSLAYRSTS